jgi:ribonuclease HI
MAAEPERFADYLIVFSRRRYAVFDNQGGRMTASVTLDEPWAEDEIEYRTLLAALHFLWQRLGPQVARTVVVVRGDSRMVIEQLTGNRKAGGDPLRRLRDEARQLLRDFKRYRLVWQSPEDTQAILGEDPKL